MFSIEMWGGNYFLQLQPLINTLILYGPCDLACFQFQYSTIMTFPQIINMLYSNYCLEETSPAEFKVTLHILGRARKDGMGVEIFTYHLQP